ncbi:MAG: phytanoyl-CoA dioxygenase family protein [Myxococcota bacterium]
MPAADHRLTTREMSRFVADGFLRFDALVPDAINERVVEELEPRFRGQILQQVGSPESPHAHPESLTPLADCHPPPSVLGEMLRLPEVQGILTSLVGPSPTFDHDFVHFLPAGSAYGQHLHVDAITDSADPTFDVQLFYYPVDVRPGEGGTRFVPGSHLRRVRAEGVSRYQHVVGEQQFAGPAGTVLVAHQGLWHCGRPNPGGRDRWMYKIRLNPTVPQVRLWNLDDFDEVHNAPSDHVFATVEPGSVASTFRHMQPWQRGHEARLELVARARLWRYLSGDREYDVDFYLTRMERRAALLDA